MSSPTLYQFVAARLPEDLGADIHAHARVIVAEIPADDVEDYLAQAVASILADVIGARRRRAMDVAARPDLREEVEEPMAEAEPSRQPQPSTPPVHNRRRVNRHRSWWTDLLAQRGLAADGGHKLIGAMTAEDLRANIDHREALARENVARADQFRRLLKLLEDQGAETVADVQDIPDSLAA